MEAQPSPAPPIYVTSPSGSSSAASEATGSTRTTTPGSTGSVLVLPQKPAYVHAPCSSPDVLSDKLSKIFGIYECVVAIFNGFTPFEVLQFMLASKDMAYLISRDPDLIKVLCEKYFKILPAPKLVVPCEWCQQPGCECAGCYQWDHNGYVCFQGVAIRCFPPKGYTEVPRKESSFLLTRRQGELNAQPKYTNPAQRLWRFCAECTQKLPAWAWAGRCVCNKSNTRSMCMSCKDKEGKNLIRKGYGMWFKPRRNRPQIGGSRRQRGEAMIPPKHFCEGLDDEGYLCENEVGPLGGFPAGEKAKGKGGRMVNVCTWCGLVAVDVPNGPPRFRELATCPGNSAVINGSSTSTK